MPSRMSHGTPLFWNWKKKINNNNVLFYTYVVYKTLCVRAMLWCYADSLMGESAKHSVNTTHSKRFHTLGRSEKSARSLVYTTVYSWQLSNTKILCARGRLKKIYMCVRTIQRQVIFFFSLSSSLEKISCRHTRGRLIGKQCARGKKWTKITDRHGCCRERE